MSDDKTYAFGFGLGFGCAAAGVGAGGAVPLLLNKLKIEIVVYQLHKQRCKITCKINNSQICLIEIWEPLWRIRSEKRTEFLF